jgi:Na+-driven multidrug efflux pump
MAHFSTACSVFIPPNYDAGNYQRVKRFVKIAQIGCTLYSFLCFGVYALMGQWYYGTLFTDPQIIAYGTEYWLWQGVGYVAVSVLCVMRTVYDSVGLGKLSLVCGVCELGSNLLCAFWLIPSFGIIGRNLSYPLGYWIAALFLLISYPLLRKRIYAPAKQTQNA